VAINDLTKAKIIQILAESKVIIQSQRSSDAGAEILFDIETILTDLDCCVKNIVQFANILHRSVCLLEDTYNILEASEYNEIKTKIRILNNAINDLHMLSIREIKGENCTQKYVNYGFSIHKYNPEYSVA